MKRQAVMGMGLVVLLAVGCGPEMGNDGAVAMRLQWLGTETRGLSSLALTGIVDTIRVTVSHGGDTLQSAEFAYAEASGVVGDIPAGTARSFLVEAVDQSDAVLYHGTEPMVTIVKDQQTELPVEMAAAYAQDIYPPARVADLAGEAVGLAIALTWTASGDDAWAGMAAWYDLRYSHSPINDSNFFSATQVAALKKPEEPGVKESFLLDNLLAGSYYLALVVVDDDGNTSELSNVFEVNVE